MGLVPLFWGDSLANATLWMLALDFLIPLVLVLANAGCTWKHASGFGILQVFFYIFMAVALLNLGEMNTHYAAYEGNALKNTPFFSPFYVFSFKHLRDVFFMFFWGGGLASILVIIGGT